MTTDSTKSEGPRNVAEARYVVYAAHLAFERKNNAQNRALVNRALDLYARFLTKEFGRRWRMAVSKRPGDLEDRAFLSRDPEALTLPIDNMALDGHKKKELVI